MRRVHGTGPSCEIRALRHSCAMRVLALILLFFLPASLRAQPLDPAALRDAALAPYLERSAYLDLLADTVDGLTPAPARLRACAPARLRAGYRAPGAGAGGR